MGLEQLLKLTQKKFVKRFGKKRGEVTCHIADDMPPAYGLKVDNPQLEYILDQEFLPFGRCYLTYGKKGNSKTSLFFDLAKLFQRNGGDVIWVETEKAADLNYARKQGVDTKRLAIPEVHTLQETLCFIEDTIKNLHRAYPDGDTPVLICLDSIAGVCPEYSLQSDVVIGEAKVGEHARLMADFYRRIVDPLSYEKCIFLGLNQLRDQIGGMQGFGSEKPEALIGGEAQRFHSTYQWKVVRTKDLVAPDPEHKGAERKIGSRHEITGKRNKLGREGNSQKAEFDLYINGGIDWYSPLVRRLAAEYEKLVSKDGGWYYWNTPGVEFVNPTTNETQMITHDKNYREGELARMLMHSPDAKQIVREAFKINPPPSQEVIDAVEADRKKARKKTKSAEEDDEGGSLDDL